MSSQLSGTEDQLRREEITLLQNRLVQQRNLFKSSTLQSDSSVSVCHVGSEITTPMKTPTDEEKIKQCLEVESDDTSLNNNNYNISETTSSEFVVGERIERLLGNIQESFKLRAANIHSNGRRNQHKRRNATCCFRP
jgi:hypothetical protein